jgi:putative SOS response-associated peptidase YedK
VEKDIDARAETVAEKPMFRSAFKRSRCLIPAFAGLWDEWKNIETGEPLKSCTMIVTNANELAAKIHDRMPVLLTPNEFEPWLSGQAGIEILNRAPELMLQAWPVARRVNSSRAPSDDPTLIDAI